MIIDPFYFIIAFAVGILYVYLFTPQPDVILVYPTPSNYHNLQYQDKADQCYRFKMDRVECPHDHELFKINAQE